MIQPGTAVYIVGIDIDCIDTVAVDIHTASNFFHTISPHTDGVTAVVAYSTVRNIRVGVTIVSCDAITSIILND